MSSLRLFHNGIRHRFIYKRSFYSHILATKLCRINTAFLTRGLCQVVHPSSPPVFDSKVGFLDYEEEKAEYSIEVPKFFNFANMLDNWASSEEVSV